MGQIIQGFYPINQAGLDPNVRGDAPEGFVIVRDIAVGDLTAGKATITLTGIPFGKDKGEIYGVQVIKGANTGDLLEPADNADLNILLVADGAVAGSNAGEVDVDIVVSDATSTVNDLVVSLILYGRILPINA